MKTSRTLASRWPFVIRSLWFSVLAVSLADSFKSTDEKIPLVVTQNVHQQIESYLGSADFKGIPLLDEKSDWNNFTNWPDEFGFKGLTYQLRIWSDSDSSTPVECASREDIKPGRGLRATYQRKDAPDKGDGLKPSAYWQPDGTVHEKAIEWNRQLVFEFKYYPCGELFSYARHGFANKDRQTDYYDRTGSLAGTESIPDGQSQAECRWNDLITDAPDFEKQKIQLLLNYFKK
jgi:hypothetical protein